MPFAYTIRDITEVMHMLVNIPAQTWTQLSESRSILITQRSKSGVIAYSVSDTQPTGFDEQSTVSQSTLSLGDKQLFTELAEGDRVWAYSPNGSAVVNVVDSGGVATPDGVFSGTRAITQQGYTQANIKNGLQFFFRKSYPLGSEIIGEESTSILFETGDKPVIVKDRDVSFIGEELSIQIFESPTVSANGNAIEVANFNRLTPQPTTVNVYASPTVTDNGINIDSEPEFLFGAATAFTRQLSTLRNNRERILKPNTKHLILITNTTLNVAARLSIFVTWYEGEPDLPVTT